MTKLRFDLSLIPLDYADSMRSTFKIFTARNDPNVRFLSNDTILELDYGIYDLEKFQDIKPSPVQRLLKYPMVIDKTTIFDRFATDEYKEDVATNLEESRQACRDFDFEDIPDIEDALDQPGAAGVMDVLEDQKGLVIGGSHNDDTHRAPIMDMLESGGMSRENGNGLLFIEELPASAQPDINAFLDSDPDTDMPATLKAYLQTQSKVFQTDFVKMMEMSRANGVRVIGTDADDVKIYDDVEGAVHHERRCAAQNMKTKEIVDAALLQYPDQKFVALVGGAHSNTHEGGVPGLSQLLDVPAIKVDVGGKLRQDKEDPAKRESKPKEVLAFVDGYIARMAKDFKENSRDGRLLNDLVNWKEQRALAEKMAQTFVRGGMDGGPLSPGVSEARIADLVDSPAVGNHIEDARVRYQSRLDGKKELVALLDNDDPAAFRTRLDELTTEHPDLLHHDGEEGLITSVMTKAVSKGHAELIPDCLAKGAAMSSGIAEDIFNAAIGQRESAARDGVAPDEADLALRAQLTHILDAGIDPNGKNRAAKKSATGQRDLTPMQLMVRKGMADAVSLMADRGAATNIKDLRGMDMLQMAVADKQPSLIATLVDKGFDPNVPGPDGQPLLITALQAGDGATAKALLAKGAATNVIGPGGKSAVQLAVELGDKSVVDTFVDKGADLSVADDNGVTGARAMLVAELTQQVDEAVNGDRRAAAQATENLRLKEAELSEQREELAALEAEQEEINIRLNGPVEDLDFDDLIRNIDLLTETYDAERKVRVLERERGTIQSEIDDHTAADPLNDLVDASKAEIETHKQRVAMLQAGIDEQQRLSVEGATEQVREDALATMAARQIDLKATQDKVRDEEKHLANLQSPQPIYDRLIQTAADALEAAGPLGTPDQINSAIAGASDDITALRDTMLDRQTQLQKMVKAVKDNDATAIAELAEADPSLIHAKIPDFKTDRVERDMLQYAAKKQNMASITALLEGGANPNTTDKTGATALHSVFTTRQDAPELKTVQKDIVAALIDAGADMNAQDRNGRTCLHLACLDGNPDAITHLITAGADQTITDNRDWTAKDVVVATTKPLAEKAYADAAHANISPSLIREGDDTIDTVELLMRATKCEDPEQEGAMRDMYNNLYADPMFRPMLDLVALDAAQKHEASKDGEVDTGLRIFVAANKQVGLLYNRNHGEWAESVPQINSPRGAYEENAHVVHLGAGKEEPGTFVPGTLIHELTHAATRIIYGSEDIPAPVGEGTYTETLEDGSVGKKMAPELAETDYVKAIMADAKSAARFGNPGTLGEASDTYRIHDVLFGRMDKSYKTKGDKALLQEYLVSIPQLVAEFGREPVAAVAPSLVDYYENSFSEACTAQADDEKYSAVKDKLDNDDLIEGLGDPVVREPDMSEPGKPPRTSIDNIMKRVEQIYVSEHGTPALAERDAGLDGILSLPFSGANFKLPARDQARLDRKLAVIRTQLEKSYDPTALPDRIDGTMLQGMATELVHLAQNNSGRSLKNGVAGASGYFVRESQFRHLEAKYASGERLDSRDVAELVLMRAENQVWTQAHGGDAPRIEFDPKSHGKTLDALTERLDQYLDEQTDADVRAKLLSETTDVDAFITNEVQALANDRGMRVSGGKVKSNDRRAKNVWYNDLKALAA